MKLVCVIILFTFTFSSIYSQSQKELKAFQEWKSQFKKKYPTKNAELKALSNFLINLRFIENHNRQFKNGNVSTLLGLWDESDQRTIVTNLKINRLKMEMTGRNLREDFSAKRIPKTNLKSIDYVKLGYVNPVRRQYKCGCCYVFVAVETMEGQIFKKTGILPKLSEQHLLDCARGQKYSRNRGCSGGVVSLVYDYIKENGVSANSTYPRPFQAADNFTCDYNPSTSVSKLTSHVWPRGIDEERLKDLLVSVGPLSVCVDASKPTFINYKSGVYKDENCSSKEVNHAMVLVGFGSDAVHGDFWVLKNSYGTKWGDKGYMKLQRGKNRCGITVYVTYPII